MTNDVSPQVILAFLTDAWNRAGNAVNSLRDTLLADQSAALGLVSKGSVASVGKNSANQTYKGYGAGSLTQVQIVEIIGNLLGLYDQLQSQITCAFDSNPDFDGVPADYDFDPAIYSALSKIFNAQSSGAAQMLPDVTRLRLPPSLILTSNQPSVTTW